LDFYKTPAWQTQALRRRVEITGSVFECCVGDHSIARQFQDCRITTNDIDPQRRATFHKDASNINEWSSFGQHDWVVTNPPFNRAIEILGPALQYARTGVVMLLRLSFLEPTEKRGASFGSIRRRA
jgi:hypothetical protein